MRKVTSGYNKTARDYLKQCEKALNECHLILDSVEGRLETTPKPSEYLESTFAEFC